MLLTFKIEGDNSFFVFSNPSGNEHFIVHYKKVK
jgi:hypothetical protein